MSKSEEYPPCPDSDWYAEECQKRNSGPVCPYKATAKCQQYYDSSVVGQYLFGEKAIAELDDYWLAREGSLVGERAPRRTNLTKENFCPELLGEKEGLFTNTLCKPPSDEDKELTDRNHDEQGMPKTDLRRPYWNPIIGMHFTDCPSYQFITQQKQEPNIYINRPQINVSQTNVQQESNTLIDNSITQGDSINQHIHNEQPTDNDASPQQDAANTPKKPMKKRGRKPKNDNDAKLLKYWEANKHEFDTYEEFFNNQPEGIDLQSMGYKSVDDIRAGIKRAKTARDRAN